jgi:hypothetical protein
MTKYKATVMHHSISQGEHIDVGDNLLTAKRRATARFGAGFTDHMIVIWDTSISEYPTDRDAWVCTKLVNGKWRAYK